MNAIPVESRPNNASGTDTVVAVAADGILYIEGAEATSYLNSQLSSDIEALDPQASLLTSYSDPRGRVLAVPRLLPRGDGAWCLVLDRGLIEPVAAQLRKFALRAQVTFSDYSADWRILGIAGDDTAAQLRASCGALPEQPNGHCLTDDGLSIYRLPDAAPRWQVCGPAAAIAQLETQLGAANGSEDAWRERDVRAGLPRLTPATTGHFVAQMLNLDRLGAIDFRKGCFPGQEVIARTRYLGRIKRRMFVLETTKGPTPEPGSTVFGADGENAAGEIVDAVATPDGGMVALAVLRLADTSGDLHPGGPEAPVAALSAPPYGLDDGGE